MKVALAGDTMLGRGVAEVLTAGPATSLVDDEVVAFARDADLFVLNLECCISERGTPWPDRSKPFFFRAPPNAVGLLVHLGVDCVTLANNHALDFGAEALLDTLEHLRAAGISAVGAGSDLAAARAPATLEAAGRRLAVLGLTDHPAAYAAAPDRPGVAYADLAAGLPSWVAEAVGRAAADVDGVLVMPHWGPNMSAEPVPHVKAAADALVDAGASLVAGHSAHIFHGAAGRVVFDLGDFLDDYRVDAVLRNDLGLLFRVELQDGRPTRLEALPLRLDYCFTRTAHGADADWIRRRFADACARLGAAVRCSGDVLTVSLG